jgi:transglutaminase-like putative cysteine protease
MHLIVVHDTVYHYAPEVDTARHVVYLEPTSRPAQTVADFSLSIDPPPAQLHRQLDVYGNARWFFYLQSRHQRLHISARSEVHTKGPLARLEGRLRALTWEAARSRYCFYKGARWDEATEFVFPSDFVERHADFYAYAMVSLSAKPSLADAAIDLMQRLHRDMRYVAQSTDLHTPAHEAFTKRKGVCQDFAHILLACFRSVGLAAQYVSGYLLTTPPEGQPRLIGADASHAWVALYLPLEGGGQWLELDPTNNRWGIGSAGEDYVVLATGRDYADISPVRGVIHGGADHHMDVSVTVSPFEQ